jgi:hypothetical protein
MQPSNAKIVWGFSRIVPYLKHMIYTSRYINTDDKDGLMNDLEKMLDTLNDVVKREGNIIPYPPSFHKAIEKQKKKKGS